MQRFERAVPALFLFLVAPLVAEFLPGNMSVHMLGTLAVLAPLYGGGGLLIRETVRRAELGWASLFVLALSYGVWEEGVVMQSLFNPDFLGLHQHLLAPAHLPGVGMGGWWTVFVLTLHAVWSIPVPIALAEALFPRRARETWLNKPGLVLAGVVFLAGSGLVAISTVRRDPVHFVATGWQLGGAAVACAGLIGIALRIRPAGHGETGGRAPGAAMAGAVGFAAGAVFLSIPKEWGWWAALVCFWMDAGVAGLVLSWSAKRGWGAGQRLGLSAGAAGAYAAHAFAAVPVAGERSYAGNAAFCAGLGLLVWGAAVRVRRAEAVERPARELARR